MVSLSAEKPAFLALCAADAVQRASCGMTKEIKMRLNIILILLSLVFSTIAASSNLKLSSHAPPQYWIIKNNSQQSLILNHPDGEVGVAHAGWGSELQPGKFSVLYLNAPSFLLSCRNYHRFVKLDCYQVLQVLSVPTMLHRDSTYWRVENTSFDSAVKSIASQ